MPVATESKRQNFNVTPDQEAELLALQREFDAPSVKDAILRAVRLARFIGGEVRSGRRLALKDANGLVTEVALPDIQPVPRPEWKYLVQRPESWKKQLFVKGRRLTAFQVWSDMLVNKMTPVETAEDWDLPEEAIQEIIDYCEANKDLLKMEAQEEKLYLLSHGVRLEPQAAVERRAKLSA